MRYRLDRLIAYARDLFGDLPRRVVLTVQYHGWRELIRRIVTFPVRLTPWGAEMHSGRSTRWALARRWYRNFGKPVAIVMPHYGEPTLTIQAVESIKATTKPALVRIIVTDDGSAPEHLAALRGVEGLELVESDRGNTGFAANANRGIAMAGDLDVVLLNNDVIAMPGWLEQFQYAAYRGPDIGIVGPKLLYPDGSIQSAGTYRNVGAPEWFDHRYRFKPADHPPAQVGCDVLATTGAAMYLKRATLDELGVFDETFGMAYEDVDLCLRAWALGMRVWYDPCTTLTHLESKTRPVEPGDRELESQRYFWEKWGDWFDRRNVRTPSGALRLIYVTEDTGIGGGHRVIFQHLNNLRAQGHEAELWTLEQASSPDWFDLDAPIRFFKDYKTLAEALEPLEAIKVATWWNTAVPVWLASVRSGIGVYHVQDIETSYYPGQPEPQKHVMASYREEFRYMCGSRWIGDRLRELGLQPEVITPGLDRELWHPLPKARREGDVLLSAGRTNPLKNLGLTIDGWRAVPEDQRPQLWLFGIEPELGEAYGARYIRRPSDSELNELYNRCTALIQTSRHEGFCLPLLEAMATGAPVICTDSNGNRDFIRDGVNCLLVEHDDPESVARAVQRLFGDADLQRRLGEEGRRTAAEFELRLILDRAERFFDGLVAPARTAPTNAGRS